MEEAYLGFLVLCCLTVTIGASQSGISGFLDVDNGKLYYEMAGSGEQTIVLIHDGLVHGEVWNNQYSLFSEKYRVVRYDRRGYGRSSQPEEPFSNIEDLHSVFTSLDIPQAILIGMSAGGGLAIDYTLEHPERVSALVVAGAVVSGFGYSNHFLTRGGRLTFSDYADPEKLMRYLILEDPYEISPENAKVREELWTLMESYPQNIDFTKNRLAVPPEHPAIDRLGEMRIPTLIVIGEFDIPDVFVHAGAIESGIPFAERVIIRDAGHLVPLEQPDQFNEHVLEFIHGAEFLHVLQTEGIAPAVMFFDAKRELDPAWVPFSEARLNTMGYRYLQTGRIQEAIGLFEINVRAYPESANTYDSLGEAYMINGNRELAIQNYRKSLEIDPENENAIEKLEQLEEQ